MQLDNPPEPQERRPPARSRLPKRAHQVRSSGQHLHSLSQPRRRRKLQTATSNRCRIFQPHSSNSRASTIIGIGDPTVRQVVASSVIPKTPSPPAVSGESGADSSGWTDLRGHFCQLLPSVQSQARRHINRGVAYVAHILLKEGGKQPLFFPVAHCWTCLPPCLLQSPPLLSFGLHF